MMKLWIVCLVAIVALCSSTFGQTKKCNRPHEVYACGSACQTTCENLNKPCPIVNIRCNDDCYCELGYARNSRGVCIPIERCPRNSPFSPRSRFIRI